MATKWNSDEGYRERGLCPAHLAYRTMADIGPARRCGNPAKTAAGWCRRHDPETAPKRDKWGRIVKKQDEGTAENPHVYGRGTRLSSCYTMGRDGLPCPRYVERASLGRKAWERGVADRKALAAEPALPLLP